MRRGIHLPITVSEFNMKGGVGKTALTLQLKLSTH